MAQPSPIHSWNLIGPWVVSAVKSGASLPIRSVMNASSKTPTIPPSFWRGREWPAGPLSAITTLHEDRVRRRRTRRALLRHPHEAARPRATRSRSTSATGPTTPSAGAWCSPTRRCGNFAEADPESHAAIERSFARWTRHRHLRSAAATSAPPATASAACPGSGCWPSCRSGPPPSGVAAPPSRREVRPRALPEADLVVAADGVNSRVRDHLRGPVPADASTGAAAGSPGSAPTSASRPSPSSSRRARTGSSRCTPIPSTRGTRTFIVECHERGLAARPGSTRPTRRTRSPTLRGSSRPSCGGHRLLANRSIWRAFPTVRNERWHHGNVVLLGDAAHTAHFSIGSGTKLAMEDAIALRDAFRAQAPPDVPSVLAAYEEERKAEVGRLQPAAQTSLEWFENAARYRDLDPLTVRLQPADPQQAHHLRQPGASAIPTLVAAAAEVFARTATGAAASASAGPVAPRRRFTPFRLRGLALANRIVVSPMCQYSAEDGTPERLAPGAPGQPRPGRRRPGLHRDDRRLAEGRITPGCAGMYGPSTSRAWKRIVDFVHRHSPPRSACSSPTPAARARARAPGKADEPLPEGGWELLAPSALPFAPGWPVPRAMDRADMDRVRDGLRPGHPDGRGGRLRPARAAHGPRLPAGDLPLAAHQPARRRVRRDARGPPALSRSRCFDAVRAAWPAAKPISVRISATDWAAGRHRPAPTASRSRARCTRAGLRHRRRLGGRHRPRPAAGLRAHVPGAVHRGDPAGRRASPP